MDADYLNMIGWGKDLEDAIDIATEYMFDHEVEYGCCFTPKLKK